jgi:hypothetical protein
VIAETNIEDVALYVRNTNSLVKLCLRDNRIGIRGANTTVKEIDLSGNTIGNLGARALVKTLTSILSLRVNNEIDESTMKEILCYSALNKADRRVLQDFT